MDAGATWGVLRGPQGCLVLLQLPCTAKKATAESELPCAYLGKRCALCACVSCPVYDVECVSCLQVRPDLKPASMATVEAEFEKQPQRNDWQAARVSRWATCLIDCCRGLVVGPTWQDPNTCYVVNTQPSLSVLHTPAAEIARTCC